MFAGRTVRYNNWWQTDCKYQWQIFEYMLLGIWACYGYHGWKLNTELDRRTGSAGWPERKWDWRSASRRRSWLERRRHETLTTGIKYLPALFVLSEHLDNPFCPEIMKFPTPGTQHPSQTLPSQTILTSCLEVVLVVTRVTHSLTHKTFNLHQSELHHFWRSFWLVS